MDELDLARARAKARAAAGGGQDQYKGSVLPFSIGPDGKARFDSDAGIVGSIKRAVTLPRDYMEGKVDPHTDEGWSRMLEAGALMTPVNPGVRAGDRAIPGVARQKTVRGKVAPPTADELLDTAGRQYDAVRDAGVDYKSSAVADMARALRTGLERDGTLDVNAPNTHEILRRLSDPPSQSVAPIQNLEAARRSLTEISQGAERASDRGAAKRAIRELSAFIERADPSSVVAGPAAEAGRTLKAARGNYAAGKRSDQLHGIERNATLRAHASHSGSNEGNTIRQRLATLLSDKKVRPGHPIRGYTAEETAAIQGVVDGSLAANATRRVGNVLGGGGGLGQLAAMGVGSGVGMLAGGPAGGGIGAALPVVAGTALKGTSNALTRRALRNVDKMTRARSPLMSERRAAAPQTPIPTYTRDALMRALMLAAPDEQ